MQNINIYDIESERIERLSIVLDVTAAEIVEALFDAIDKNDIDLEEYL